VRSDCEDLVVLRRARKSTTASMGYYYPVTTKVNSDIARRVFECDWGKLSAAFGRMRNVPTRETAVGWMWSAYCDLVIPKKDSLVVKMLESSSTVVLPIMNLEDSPEPLYNVLHDIETYPSEHSVDAYSVTESGQTIYYKHTTNLDHEICYSAFELWPSGTNGPPRPMKSPGNCLLVWVVPLSIVDKVTAAPITSAFTIDAETGRGERLTAVEQVFQQCVLGLDYTVDNPLNDDE
jgi:hypothetical protein